MRMGDIDDFDPFANISGEGVNFEEIQNEVWVWQDVEIELNSSPQHLIIREVVYLDELKLGKLFDRNLDLLTFFRDPKFQIPIEIIVDDSIISDTVKSCDLFVRLFKRNFKGSFHYFDQFVQCFKEYISISFVQFIQSCLRCKGYLLIDKFQMAIKILSIFILCLLYVKTASAEPRQNESASLRTPQEEEKTAFTSSSTSSSQMTDVEVIQQVLEGIFSENKMEGPFMIKYCFNDKIAHSTVTFLADSLEKAARGSAKDLVSLIQETNAFIESLPEPFIECLGKCQEIRSLGWKYDIDGSTDFKALEIKLTEYILLHYLQVHRWAIDLNGRWIGEYYFDVGYYGALYAHKVQHGSARGSLP